MTFILYRFIESVQEAHHQVNNAITAVLHKSSYEALDGNMKDSVADLRATSRILYTILQRHGFES